MRGIVNSPGRVTTTGFTKYERPAKTPCFEPKPSVGTQPRGNLFAHDTVKRIVDETDRDRRPVNGLGEDTTFHGPRQSGLIRPVKTDQRDLHIRIHAITNGSCMGHPETIRADTKRFFVQHVRRGNSEQTRTPVPRSRQDVGRGRGNHKHHGNEYKRTAFEKHETLLPLKPLVSWCHLFRHCNSDPLLAAMGSGGIVFSNENRRGESNKNNCSLSQISTCIATPASRRIFTSHRGRMSSARSAGISPLASSYSALQTHRRSIFAPGRFSCTVGWQIDIWGEDSHLLTAEAWISGYWW